MDVFIIINLFRDNWAECQKGFLTEGVEEVDIYIYRYRFIVKHVIRIISNII